MQTAICELLGSEASREAQSTSTLNDHQQSTNGLCCLLHLLGNACSPN
jgi:hypothetical protein